MNLSTSYLGVRLTHPFMPGPSPLTYGLDGIKRLEDAGASAIVMHSLFEEQIEGEKLSDIYHLEMFPGGAGEALSYFPQRHEYGPGPDEYLEQIRRAREAVKVPVIASLNGTTAAGWLKYASLIQQAGATALELNVYLISVDPKEAAALVDKRLLDTVSAVRQVTSLPIAVKIAPYFSSLPNLAANLEVLGVEGLVLFNRLCQPDIDVENMRVVPTHCLSDSSELPLRLRWLAILSRQCGLSMAVSGGVHTGIDAIKALLAGANAVQMVSALMKKGVSHIDTVKREVVQWMEEHGYTSLRQIVGGLDLSQCADPAAFERAGYLRILKAANVAEE